MTPNDMPQIDDGIPVEGGMPADWRASFLVGARHDPVWMDWIYWPEYDVNWMNPAQKEPSACDQS